MFLSSRTLREKLVKKTLRREKGSDEGYQGIVVVPSGLKEGIHKDQENKEIKQEKSEVLDETDEEIEVRDELKSPKQQKSTPKK